jgi:hypothetical protein
MTRTISATTQPLRAAVLPGSPLTPRENTCCTR